MNQPTNHPGLPRINRLIATPKSDLGRSVSDAGFRADHYSCNRLNVAPVSAIPGRGQRRGHVDSFTVDTSPRPLGKSRIQEASFATVAAPSHPETLKGAPAGGVVTVTENAGDFGRAATPCEEPRVAGFTMAQLEKLAIMQTLQRCSGNRTKAARMLGLSVRTLQRKLNSWRDHCSKS